MMQIDNINDLITHDIDPWNNMDPGSERLIPNKNKFKIYWGVERNGNVALYFRITQINEKILNNVNVENLEIGLFKDKLPGNYVWVIALKDKNFNDMFKILSLDLIVATDQADNEKSLLKLIQSRLMKWQELFKRNTEKFTIIQQMGLYSELKTLLRFVYPQTNIKRAIDSWIGSEFDKQDFVFKESAIEVKSYKSSKGPRIIISSKEQLDSDKKNLYLMSYALTKDEFGEGVAELIAEIVDIIQDDFSTLIEFKKKVISYGYFFDNTKLELFKFNIDSIKSYEVKDGFPRVTSQDLLPGILSIKYQVDLSICTRYEIDEANIKM